jgi:SAM-dependent methyltransferase
MPQTFLFKTLVSAKRGAKERAGVHSWHSYYAGYSEAFVTSAIEYLKLNRSHVLLDPWNGSGTTALVASRFGIQTLGCEINPVMNIFAAAKSGFLLGQRGPIKKLLRDVTDRTLQSLPESQDDDPLLDFMSESLSRGIRTLYTVIDSYDYPQSPLANRLLETLTEIQSLLNPFEAFFKAALFITARKLAGYKGGSNPTWVKTLTDKPEYCMEDIVSELTEVVDYMTQNLESSSIPVCQTVLHLPLEADSRNLCINDNSIDGIITSPPYLTRIDYAMLTRPELLIVSNPSTLRIIREKTIGAPVIVDKNIEVNPVWGETCLELLEHVERHKSKAAISYYLLNMLQYFRNAELSLREITRVLQPESRALVVVQSSYFKEHEINLGQIYVELCQNLGVHSTIANREVIRGHMAHVNTKSNLYKSGKVYCEDVVCITK